VHFVLFSEVYKGKSGVATKAINLASFKEIQWQIILVWNVGLYLKECKISSKNVLFLSWKKVRGLERHPDIYPFCQFHEKCPHFSLFLIRHWINENKTGKDNVCKGKLSFLGDIVSKLNCLLYQKFRNFIWQDFSFFKNFEENLYISHTNAL
jgi:hypothetical protein